MKSSATTSSNACEYVARGMNPETARKAALERIGDVERVRDECTGLLAAERRADGRRMALTVSWLDVKLGVRMLSKYPGLSLVSVLGMAVAIAIGAGVFGVISAIVDPTLPLPGGDRIVAILSHRADSPRHAHPCKRQRSRRAEEREQRRIEEEE